MTLPQKHEEPKAKQKLIANPVMVAWRKHYAVCKKGCADPKGGCCPIGEPILLAATKELNK